MIKSRPCLYIWTLFFTSILIFQITSSYANSSDEKGAFVNSIRFIQYLDGNTALQEVRLGNLDAYLFRIPLERTLDAYRDQLLKIYEKNAGSIDLLVNPAPSKDASILNPFEFRQIRFALNYLIDRSFVVNELLGGFGTIQIDPYGVYSPEYENIISNVESLGIGYNPNLAEKIIGDVLTSAGAKKTDGKWSFNGRNVVVKILIRSDDTPRKSVGELVASQLGKIGFDVVKEYGDLNKANTIVYGTDPKDLQWSLYTEGFGGTSAFVRYNPSILAQMYAPFYSSMPGRQNPSYWNYKNSTLDEITQKIIYSNFTSRNEREELLQNATILGILESVRIFLAQTIDPYVTTPSLKGLINDFGAGIAGRVSLINAYSTTDNNTLNIGVKQIYQGAWNGVAGCNDIYCTTVNSLLSDPGTFRNPYTGEVIPLRNTWTDITGDPIHKLKVDPDAIIWNATSQHWNHVGNNTYSKSRVGFNVTYSNWQNGEPMDINDLLYSYYFPFEWGTKTGINDTTYDPEYTPQAQVALPYLKGITFSNQTHFTAFVDYWHFDKREIADFGALWASSPWEITAATERLVKDGKYSFSKSDATVKNIDWLSLIIPSHAELIRHELEKMKQEGYIPPPLRNTLNYSEAIKRYNSSINWISNHKNALVSNGPFILDNYNPSGGVITVKAFRDKTYPYKIGYWSKYEIPKVAIISKISYPKIISNDKPIEILVNVTTNGKTNLNSEVQYFVFDRNNKIVIQGQAERLKEEGIFSIRLEQNATKHMSLGPNEFKIFARSNEALIPDIFSGTIIIVPS